MRQPQVTEELFLTTQPGWVFATLAELRARGLERYVGSYHRDSSLVVAADPPLLGETLRTPAAVYGCLARASAMPRQDATARLTHCLDPVRLKHQVQQWLAHARSAVGRRYSIGSEVWGVTAIHRRELADRVRAAVSQAFPRWEEYPSGGVRLFCKADTQAAILGVQLYSNLSQQDDGRPGALRDHLACALLTLAHVRLGDAVLDPCMGTGRVLRAAWRWLGAGTCLGVEIDREAYRVARQYVQGADTRLFNQPFEALDVGLVPPGVKLVSNLPFGVQFTTVPTDHLLAFIARVAPKLSGLALLMGRVQAAPVSRAFGLRRKHVLVLGQPAAIVYAPNPRGMAGRVSSDMLLHYPYSEGLLGGRRYMPGNRRRGEGRTPRMGGGQR